MGGESVARALHKGENIELRSVGSDLGKLSVVLSVRDTADGDVIEADISGFLLDGSGKVASNASFVFYNQPLACDGAVHLLDSRRDDEASSVVATLMLSLDDLPDEIARLVLVASVDDAKGDLLARSEGVGLEMQDSIDARSLVTFAVPSLGAERAVLVGEFYRRLDGWKFRAIGQGYADGLAAVATSFGVEVAADPEDDVADEVEAASSEAAGASVERSPESSERTSEGAAAEVASVSVKRAAPKPPQLSKDWNRSIPTEGDLQEARLFPVAGIGGAEEQERRATSALLSLLTIVRPFARDLLGPLGAPAGTVEAFLEVPYALRDDAYRPDGLLRVRRGQRSWSALVEVKSSAGRLDQRQVEAYVDIAREQGLDAVVTISNELPTVAGEHPLSIDRRKLKKVKLIHLPWGEIKTTAQLVTDDRFPDPTQRRLLAEFLRYVDHDRSGMGGFTDMGARWAKVRESAKKQTLQISDAGTAEVVDRFDQLMHHTALQLTGALGVRVKAAPPLDAPDHSTRRQQLVDSGALFGSLRVPRVPGRMVVRADIRADTVSVTYATSVPKAARADTRGRWLIRQVPGARADCHVQSIALGTREVRPALLADLREDPGALAHVDGREPAEFRLTYTRKMGQKRASGEGTFIQSVVGLVTDFYGEVVQNITPPPKP